MTILEAQIGKNILYFELLLLIFLILQFWVTII